MSRFAAPIAEQIWRLKYRLTNSVDDIGESGAAGGRARLATTVEDAVVEDQTVEDTWRRVARALAAAEKPKTRAQWETHFYKALEDFKFLPAGRILAGAGAGRKVTLFNCFVMGRIPDSMGGIFDMLKEAALTLQQGGGIGYDFSTLRPKGAGVAGVGADASGPISFMDVWDSMCRTIMSAGSRRGAMMATLRCDHPDIEDFVAAKRDAARLRMFNLSVLVTDDFMRAVETDADWKLNFDGRVYKTLPARELWDQIMRATYDYAEPGVIFIDRVNARNNLRYAETIHATNPCGEQPLPPYGACLLGSINLARLVKKPFAKSASIDLQELADLVAVSVRMMDNVVDISDFALEAQAQEARSKRRIGLGVTGLADALLMLGVEYGGRRAVKLSEIWLKALRDAAYRASVELAREKGAFPLFDAEEYCAAPAICELDDDLRADIAEHGTRNALLTSIAPTGTISLYAGNVSSGIEPIFAPSYTRRMRRPDGGEDFEEVVDFALALYRRKNGGRTPAGFVTAQDLTPDAHLKMQAAAQKYIDSAISKTINLPEDISFEDFKNVYQRAYETGCKGCTTYRPNAITGAVLSATSETEAATPVASAVPPPDPAMSELGGDIVYMREPIDRPDSLIGATYKLRWPESAHAIYITVNDIVIDDRRRPFEVFINSKNMEHYAWTVALTRMISAVFRRGGDVAFVVEELKAVFDPRGGAWIKGKYVPSILAAIGGVIERHLKEIGFLEADAATTSIAPPASAEGARAPRENCLSCSSLNVMRIEGCATCAECGFSQCA